MTVLSKGWVETRLGDLGDSIKGSVQPNAAGTFELYSVPSFSDGQPEILKGAEIGSHKRPVCPFDLLVCKINPRINRVWVVAPRNDHEQLASPEWLVLRSPAPGLSAMLRYQLSAPDFRRWIERGVHGVTGSHTRAKDDHVLDFPTRVPPEPEQERIVAAIEEAFSKLDAGDAGLRTVRQLLKRMRDAILAAAVTGRLVVQDPTDPPVAAREDWTSSKEDPFSDRELPELPNGWRWTRAASACEAVECGGTPPAQHMSQGAGDVPFIKVYNLTLTGALDFSVNPTFIDSATHARQRRSSAQPGDVLTNIVGPPLGKVAVVPPTYPSWNMNQAVVMFRSGESLVAGYLAIALQSSAVIERLSRTARATAGQFNVSLTACRYLPLPLPPPPEQQRIVDEVARQLSVVEACGRALDVGAERSAALRRSVLKAAFEGRLVPQDPSEEPASVLLARIREERAAAPKAARSRRTA